MIHIHGAETGKCSFALFQEYLDVTKKHYSAEAQTCDFIHDAAGSRSLINKWVEEQTKEKIKDLIPDGFINELTRLILVNAIYFKGITKFTLYRNQWCFGKQHFIPLELHNIWSAIVQDQCYQTWLFVSGNWKDQFNPERTRKSNFYINDKDTVEVDMMFQEEQFALGFDKALGVQVGNFLMWDHF